jgi:hypothetical protein
MVRNVGDMKIFRVEIGMRAATEMRQGRRKHAVSVASVRAAGKSFDAG